jgi:hypothetical protein
MIVAQLRGIEFVQDRFGTWSPYLKHRDESFEILDEVAATLGFRNADVYLEALECERGKIFRRLKK